MKTEPGTQEPMSVDRLVERFAHLGTRAAAQQIVLARNVGHYRSWRDVDAEIKKVEREIIALASVSPTPGKE